MEDGVGALAAGGVVVRPPAAGARHAHGAVMPFPTWAIMPLGTSSFQNRCHRVSPISRAASSGSAGWVVGDW